MAEKYGTVPKKFTKEWWSWYWMYYKWITLGVIFVLSVVGFTVYSSITAEKFDATVTYAGKLYYTDVFIEKMEEVLSPLCEDLDGNGEKNLYFSHININHDSKDVEYIQANTLKLNMAMSEDASYIFFFDKTVADVYKRENADDILYAPLEDWVDGDISGFETYDAYGKAYGIDISNLKLFKDAGLDTSGLYMFVRYYPRKNQIKNHLKGYEASIRLANKILNY